MARPQPLDRHLDTAPDAARVMAHARLLLRLGHLYAQFAPGMLAETSRVANFKAGIVVVHADNGAVAAKLKQMAGRLTEEFLRRGIECSGVEVKVQPSNPIRTAPIPPTRPLSADAVSSVQGAMATLPEKSPLRAALAELLQRSAKRG